MKTGKNSQVCVRESSCKVWATVRTIEVFPVPERPVRRRLDTVCFCVRGLKSEEYAPTSMYKALLGVKHELMDAVLIALL